MTPLSILLTLASAFIHSSWNFVAKKGNWPIEFFFWVFLVGTFLYLPFFIGFGVFSTFLLQASGRLWVLSVISGAIQAVYLISLIEAYRVGDLSLVYPLSRSAPLFTQIWAVLFIGEILSALGVLGIVLVTTGIFVTSSGHFQTGRALPPSQRSALPVLLAVLAALTGSVYSVIDKVCVQVLHPVFYTWLINLLMCAAVGIYRLFQKKEALLKVWRDWKKEILLIALLQNASYLLILMALKTSKVSYVVAFRQAGVLFAAGLGIFFLKESHGKARMMGALILTVGLVLIGLAR